MNTVGSSLCALALIVKTALPFRNEQRASLVVDNGNGVFAESPGQLRQLNTDTGLYVGELSSRPLSIIF
jgi:hypothetical protein